MATIPAGAVRDAFRFLSTRANRQPAIAAYRRETAGGTFDAWGILVFSADGDAIAEITTFIDVSLIPVFGLPTSLDASEAASLGST